ncbi:hypothetical protein Y1Q_0022812 [Alligator mississippiensis]|uniref:Uncharacterized protein n=1 Tax=Alligator mississippiensis TaxID=8496 RepID=A0A151N4V5_ALLMI|nr:hypothetical protein Y1Q_0022812 [Alligator mississippiensis]
MVTGVKTMNREAALFSHLTKQQETLTMTGSPPASGTLCGRPGTCSGTQNSQLKTASAWGRVSYSCIIRRWKEMAEDAWKRKEWHRLFKNEITREEDNGKDGEEGDNNKKEEDDKDNENSKVAEP